MSFRNPVVGGGGGLIRNWIQSPDFVTGVSGWQIARDGTAEFNDVLVRGTLEVNNGNSQLRIIPGSSPANSVYIYMNPDTTQYVDGRIFVDPGSSSQGRLWFESPTISGEDSCILTMSSEVSGNASPAMFTNAETLTTNGRVVANAFVFGSGQDYSSFGGNSAAIVPNTNNDMRNVTITAKAGETYFFVGRVHGMVLTGPVAYPGNQVILRISRGAAAANPIGGVRRLLQNTAVVQDGSTVVAWDTPGAGTFTYYFNLFHEAASGAATVAAVGTATSPIDFGVFSFSV
jgi:hypothetical protein